MTATSHRSLTPWTGQWTIKCRMGTGSLALNQNTTTTSRTANGGFSSARFKTADFKNVDFEIDLKKRSITIHY